MANTNEVEQLEIPISMNGASAQETLKLILGSLNGIQNKLLAIGKTPINIGGGYTQVSSDLTQIQKIMSEMTSKLKTNSTTWNDVVGYINKYGENIANAEAKVEILNKSIKTTKNLEKELIQQKEFNNKQSLKYDKDALVKKKREEEDSYKARIKDINKFVAEYEQVSQNYGKTMLNTRKALVEDITKTNPMLQNMNKYYADLEKNSTKAMELENKVKLKNTTDFVSKYEQISQSYGKTMLNTRKTILEDMTKKSPALQDLGKYYSELEKSGVKATEEANKAKLKNTTDFVAKYEQVSQNYGKTMLNTRKAILEDMTKTNPLLQNMNKYYADLEKSGLVNAKAQAQIKTKSNLDEQIALARRQVYEQASDKSYATKLGNAQLKTKEIMAELNILKQVAQTEEVITRTRKVQTELAGRATIERKARLADQQADEQYNNVMSVHSAKRALGYTALFAGIGAVTGALGAMASNVIEADLQMRTLGAVLKLNITQARDLSESVRDLGGTYGGSLKEIEGVALALARAGIATKDMIPATEIVLRMARLTGDTFEQSASAIISFQQVFGDTTNIETLGNKLAYIANMSRLSTQDIGTFSNYALAAAKAVGMTEDAVGALATAFSVAGSNASTIGTQIRTITAIFSENSKDIVGFFNGIGVSQEGMRDKLQQGGKVSNQAMKDFIEVLGNVDNMTFNKLTGSMDKLTVNSLNLMRNNKDNVTRFMNDLEAGAEGQLKVVDTILEAHRVTFEKWWNDFLNFSQEQVTNLEELLSETNLQDKIEALQNALYKDIKIPFAMDVGLEGDSKKSKDAISKKLNELKAIKSIKEDEIKLTELNAKIEKSTGEEYLKLSEEKRALLIKIANERDSLETKSIGKTKEQMTLEIKARETELTKAKESIKVIEEKYGKESAAYIKINEYIREQEDALKKLNKTSNLPSVAQVSGTSLAEIAKDIQDKVSTGDTNVLAELNILTVARTKAVEDLTKQMEAYYAFEFKNNKEAADHIREVAGGDANQVASKEGLLKLQAEAIEKMEYSNVLTAALQDKTANVDDETRKYVEGLINANSVFGRAYNKLAELLGLQKVAFRTAEEAQKDATDASLKQLDVEYKIKQAKSAKGVYEAGGTDLQVKQKDLELLREKIKAQDKLDTSKEGTSERASKLADAELEVTKAINTEKHKGASAADKAERAQERAQERATKLAMQELDLKTKIEIAQAKLNGKALSQFEIAEKIKQISFAEAKDQISLGKINDAKLTTAEAELKYREMINDELKTQAQLQMTAWESSQVNQGLIPTEAGKLQQQILAQENLIAEAKARGTYEDSLQVDLNNLKNQQKLTELERTKEIAEINRQMNLESLQAQQQLISNAISYNANLTGNAANAQNLAQNLVKTSEVELAYITEKSNLDKKYQDEYEKNRDTLKDGSKELYAFNTRKTKELNNLERQHQQNQVLGYADIAGAMSNMFEQGSKDAQNFQRIQAGLAMVAGIQAILTQGQGDPYSAMPRMLAMAGMVVSVLANAKIAFGGIGGVKTTTSSDSLSAMKANTGTGTVLGDTEAQSESIQKSLDILENYAKPEYQTLLSMNKYLSHIASGIGGVSSLLIQEGGFAFGEGFQSTDSGWKNKVSADSSAIKGANVVGAGVQDYVAGTGGGVGMALPALLGTMLVDKLLLGGAINKTVGKVLNPVLGGIFGKTSVSSKMKDSGMYFADQLLTEATKNFVGSAYQTIETTTTKKSWFSKSTDVSSKTKTQALSNQTNNQFTMVIDNLYKTTLLAGEALDTATSTVEDRLKNFVVSIGKISLYKKSGDEIQKTLEAVFGRLGDQIATSAYPMLRSFQQVGEGMFKTMTRVATGMEEAGYYISKLGYQFKDISYWEIWNKQGNVGFEALLQSIERTEGVTYGFNNSLLQIISTIEGTAEELYGAYTTLDSIRGRLKFLGQELNGMSSQMIRGAGGVEALSSGFEAFFEGFLDESEQLAYSTRTIANEFAKLNQSIPLSKQGFRDLLNGIDLTTASGQELYGRLITLSEGFANVAEQMEENIKSLEAQLVDKSKEAFDKFVTTLNDVYGAVEGMIDRTQSLIDNITDEASDEDLYTKLVRYNKLFDEFALSEDENTYDAILKLSESLSKDEDVLPSVLTRLNKELGKMTDRQRVTRVNIIDGLGDLLGLNSQQLQQLQQGVSDGKLTNTELANITGLTVEQKQGITEFAENSKTFSTENTLSSLEAYAQQQLAIFKVDVQKEKQNLSSATFQYGDYVGLQEQIDIARATGVSYGAAKPTVEALQGLSVSTNIKQDVAAAVGYKGMSYDAAAASQIERLSQYINPEIITALSSIKQESATNIEKVATTRKGFAEQISSNISTIANNSKAYTAAVDSYNYYDKKVEKTDNGDSKYKKYKALRATAYDTMSKYAAANKLLKGTTLPKLVESYINTGYLAPTELTPILQELTRVGVPAAEVNKLQAMYANTPMKQFATGGYTGNGGVYDVAGVVHKGEYVLSQNDLKNVGGRASVEAFINGKPSNVVINLDPLIQEMRALKQENENMRQLLVKIAADGTKALSTQRGILDAVSPEEGV